MREITVAEAWEVINADREREFAEKREAALVYVGRFFKYNNSYNTEEKWWMYGRVTEVDGLGWPTGITFQKTSTGEIDVRPTNHMHIDSGGWTEVKPKEFWREAAKIRRELVALLSETAE